MTSNQRFTRRRFLEASTAAFGVAALAACAPAAPPTPTTAPAPKAEPPKPAATTAPAATPAATTAPTSAPAAKPTEAAAKPTAAAQPTAKPAAAAKGQAKGEIIVARGANLRWAHPFNGGLYEGELCDHIYESMVRFKPGTIEPVGVLAEKWTQSEDGKTWTFYLKKGIKFQNGEEVTAHDVRATFDWIFADPTIQENNYLKGKLDPANLKVVDDYTFTATMNEAYPTIALVPPAFEKVISRKALKEDPQNWMEKPGAGSGPYKIVKWSRDYMELTAWDDYRDPNVNKIRTFKYRTILEDATKLAALKAGEVDAIDQVPIEQVASMEKDPNFVIIRAKTTDGMHLNMNCGKAPLSNAKARLAVQYAVDREAIVKNILGGSGEVIGQVPPKGFLGYNENIKPFPYDPAKAKQLLQEAGFKLPVKVTLIQPNAWFPKVLEVPQAIAAQMNQAGFDVEVKVMEGGAFTEARRGSQYDLAFMQLGYGSDPDTGYLTGRIINDVWGTQYDKVPESKEVFDLIVKARSERDSKQRDQMYQKIEDLLHETGPRALLYRNVYIWATRKKVKDFLAWESTYRIWGTSIEG